MMRSVVVGVSAARSRASFAIPAAASGIPPIRRPLSSRTGSDQATTVDKANKDAMITSSRELLTLAGAEQLCDAALAEATRLSLQPLSVAVVNGCGQLLIHKVQDGAGSLVPDIALAKARSCLAFSCSTRTLRDKYAEAKPTQLTSMGAIAGGQFAPFPGGVVCLDPDNKKVLGAIGVSGASADQDEHCGITASHHIGLASDPACSSL